jgi:hypothetical protein
LSEKKLIWIFKWEREKEKGAVTSSLLKELVFTEALPYPDGREFHLIHDSSRQQYWFDNT